MPQIIRRKSNGSRTAPFSRLTYEQWDKHLLAVAQQADQDLSKVAPPPTEAGKEVLLRDMASVLFLLGGTKPEDIKFMSNAEPDGSRTTGLERIVGSLFWSATPAGKLAHDTKLMDSIVADCHKMGVIGERNLLLAIYLIGTSRLLDRPLSGIVQGHSSSGKSYIVESVARLFPPESVLHATRMTPQSLFYYDGGLAHKFVVAGERSRVQGDESADATGALRQLQSEGRITKLATESKNGKFTARTIEQQGPISYVETTTLRPRSIFLEDLNRALLLKTNESAKHTRAILVHSASRYESGTKAVDVSAIIDKHRNFQKILQRHRVAIPFAGELVRKLPAKKVEARRVGNQILSVIEAVALLHQYQRERDAQGRLIATLEDYQIARSLLVQPLGESLGVSTSPAVFYRKLKSRFSVGKVFTTAEAQEVDRKASESSVKNWLRQLADHNCVEQVEKARGPKPAKWKLGGKSPGQAVLPDLASQ